MKRATIINILVRLFEVDYNKSYRAYTKVFGRNDSHQRYCEVQ